MSAITSLGYLVFGAGNLVEWERFAVDIVGLQAGPGVAGRSLALRMDEWEQRILLEGSGEDDLLAAGWQFESAEDLESFAHRLQGAGLSVADGGQELALRRRVEKVYFCDDPSGSFRHEFFFGPHVTLMAQSFRSGILKKGFKTGELGVGHLVTASKHYAQVVEFYRKVLGLKVSCYGRGEVAPGVSIDATFFYTTNGRHHSLATAQGAGQKTTRHFMVEYEDMDDVGLAFDRCRRANVPITRNLGTHVGDHMFSFYAKSPSGFDIEMGWGGLVNPQWEVKTHFSLSEWGHKPDRIATTAG